MGFFVGKIGKKPLNRNGLVFDLKGCMQEAQDVMMCEHIPGGKAMRHIVVSLIIVAVATTAFAQGDTGVPDTLRIESLLLTTQTKAVSVTLINDQPLSGIQVPIHYSGDLLVLDSVLFGARTMGFTGADIVRADTNLGGTSQTITLTIVPLQTGVIAAGSDAIAMLYFSQNNLAVSDTSILMDTSVSPAGGLLFGDTSAITVGYRPQFVAGIIAKGVSISDRGGVLPREFELLQNYPNPFNPSTVLSIAMPEAAHVSLDIYNLLGQRVIRLYDAPAPAGYLDLIWNGKDRFGNTVGSGVYFYRVTAGSFNRVRKMVLLK